jgi:hypothetical protein
MAVPRSVTLRLHPVGGICQSGCSAGHLHASIGDGERAMLPRNACAVNRKRGRSLDEEIDEALDQKEQAALMPAAARSPQCGSPIGPKPGLPISVCQEHSLEQWTRAGDQARTIVREE